MILHRQMLLSCLGRYAPSFSENNWGPSPAVEIASRLNINFLLIMKVEARYSSSVAYSPSAVATMD